MGEDRELWRRIVDFDFDGGAEPGYFTGKLAYEQGWSHSFAERVVGEYRRFLYLTCTAGRVVVPSDEVDMAWHQHLIDTEQYWGVFCASVLRQPLHHRPNKGGHAGEVDHVELYERSLRTYADTFGTAPPGDVWPQASRRFGRESAHRRVALATNWIVPKRRVRIIGGSAAGLLAVPALVAWTRPPDVSSIALGNNAFGLSDAVVVVARRQCRRRRSGLGRGAWDRRERDEIEASQIPPRPHRTPSRAGTSTGAGRLHRGHEGQRRDGQRGARQGSTPCQAHPRLTART